MDNPLFRLMYPSLRPDDPCPHMRTLISDFASGVLGGVALIYTRSHLDGCPRCNLALAALRDVQARLEPLGDDAPPLEENRRAQVLTAWEQIDQTTGV